VIANATAEPVRDATRAAACSPISSPLRPLGRLHAARRELAGAGARFIEVGPGTVLAALLRRIVPGASVTTGHRGRR